MARRTFIVFAVLIVIAGAVPRTLWLRADPPTTSPGIVFNDEGAWVHNARNRALFGVWTTDNWNPVFVTPVFTAFEYASFKTLGVGTWQARIVPVICGLAAIAFLIAGLHAVAGPRAALIGGVWLASDYIFVMWNRAALAETTMTAFMVAAWACYAMGQRRSMWGVAAGVAAALAWFTKAAAASFIAALIIDAAWTMVASRFIRTRPDADREDGTRAAAARWTIAGLAVTTLIIGLLFVWPHWSEYRFYNWQMSVLRKPSYTLSDIKDRASWLPIVQDFFSLMWLTVVAAALAVAGIVARWWRAHPGERLLVLWVAVGLIELAVHDSGNPRRYVMLIPPIVALGALAMSAATPLFSSSLTAAGASARAIGVILALALGYIVFGSLIRVAFLDSVHEGDLKATVRLAAAASALTALVLGVWWRGFVGVLAKARMPPATATLAVAATVVWSLAQYGSWATHSGELNYQASVALRDALPPETLVQGQLATGLSLENRIHPVFIGNEFGNYADRFSRDDIRYVLTYEEPYIGYESGPKGRLITDLLDHYPAHRTVATFEIDGTPARDVAALIEKVPKR